MQAFWEIANSLDQPANANPKACREVVSNFSSINSLRTYLEQILHRVIEGEAGATTEAIEVAIPLSYRVAIDDTSTNYHIASRLKEAVIRKAHPELMQAVDSEVDWICRSAYGVSYAELDVVMQLASAELKRIVDRLPGQWHVYGRRKFASSILGKIARLRSGDKLPKRHDSEFLTKTRQIIDQFEANVIQRIKGENDGFQRYSFEDMKWLLPDILAMTIQLSEDLNSVRNLGSAKARYQKVYRLLSDEFSGKMFFGPAYSGKWHMNRLVCHFEYAFHKQSQVPVELFVRTDFDYFIGFANYWRYKNINLFLDARDVPARQKVRMLRKIRGCSSFEEVQNMLLEDITTGQLRLF